MTCGSSVRSVRQMVHGRLSSRLGINGGWTMRAFLLLSSLTVCAAAIAADAPPAGTPSSAAPAGAEVYFITPKDGETVSGDVVVRFGLKGMGVAPAGIQMPNTCHHHMLVDADDVPAADKPIGKDDHHMH